MCFKYPAPPTVTTSGQDDLDFASSESRRWQKSVRHFQRRNDSASPGRERATHPGILVAMGCSGRLCPKSGGQQRYMDHVWTHSGRDQLLLQYLRLWG